MDFWWFEIFVFGIFGVENFSKYFLGYSMLKMFQSIFHVISFNTFWKFLWLGNSAWDFLGFRFWCRDFFGFCWKS